MIIGAKVLLRVAGAQLPQVHSLVTRAPTCGETPNTPLTGETP